MEVLVRSKWCIFNEGFFVLLSESLKKTMTSSNIDFDKIVSPVGQYIRNNPVPPIVRQIRPKATRHFDDDLAAFEREEELLRKTPNSEKKRMFKPLPMAEYRSSKVAIEQQMPSSGAGKSLSKAFGITPTVEAKVSILFKNIFGLPNVKKSRKKWLI